MYLIVHKIKYNRSEVPHALTITTIKLQIWNLSPSLPPWHQATVARFASSLYSLLEGVMDLTLWGCPSWTLWGRQRDWLCRRNTRWEWRATSCPSQFSWPWSSLRILHLEETGKGDWSGVSALTPIPINSLPCSQALGTTPGHELQINKVTASWLWWTLTVLEIKS